MPEAKKSSVANKTAFILLIITAVLLILPINIESIFENEMYFQLSLIIFLFPMLIWTSINCPVVRRCLEITPLIKLGSVSLEIYLLHVPVQITIKVIDELLGLHIDYLRIYIWIAYILATFITVVVAKQLSHKVKERNYFRETVIATIIGGGLLAAIRISGIFVYPIVDNNLVYTEYCRSAVILAEDELSESFEVEDA